MKRPAGNSLDLRAWLDVAKKLGELKEVPGADAKLELGAISELNVKIDGAPGWPPNGWSCLKRCESPCTSRIWPA